jgi:glucosamine 6-phosphate synthetase-like amidotransferase/phosphosugar isomerase protein
VRGIVRHVGPRDAAPIILGGRQCPGYRGDDSAGVALEQGDASFTEGATGKLAPSVTKSRPRNPAASVTVK